MPRKAKEISSLAPNDAASLGRASFAHDTKGASTAMPTVKETLAILRTVRTSDVSDALDSMGYQQRYVMDPAMRPLYFGIRFAGLARTAEYDLIDRPLAKMPYEEFDDRQYKDAEDGLWRDPGLLTDKDEVMVIDAKGKIVAAGHPGIVNTPKIVDGLLNP